MSLAEIKEAISELPASKRREVIKYAEKIQNGSKHEKLHKAFKAGSFDELIAEADRLHKQGKLLDCTF